MEAQDQSYLGHYAGFSSRLIAYIIDLVISVAFIAISWWLITITIEILRVRAVLELLGLDDFFARLQGGNEEFVLRGVVFVLGIGFYHVLSLALANRTIGKGIMGLQVVPLKGGRIGIIRATLRYLGYIVSAAAFFLGFIWILFSRKRQGWHDKIARTCVVYTWEAKPDNVILHNMTNRLQNANEKRFGIPPEVIDP